MNINTTKKIIIASVIVVLALGASAYGYWRSDDDQSADEQGDTEESLSSANENEDNDVVSTSSVDVASEPTPVPAKTRDDGTPIDINGDSSAPAQGTATPTITAIDQTSNSITVKAIFSGTFSGSCELTLTGSSGEVLVRQSDTVQVVGYSACEAFSISKSELTPGSWRAVVSFSSETASGVSDARNFVVE